MTFLLLAGNFITELLGFFFFFSVSNKICFTEKMEVVRSPLPLKEWDRKSIDPKYLLSLGLEIGD